MKLDVLASGSRGNCYILTEKTGQRLIIDVGVSKREIMKAIHFDVRTLAGVIISHEHRDHLNVGTVAGLDLMGIPVWHPYKYSKNGHTFFRGFDVYSFDVPHDDTETRGFMVKADGHTILYITDAEYVKYSFKKHMPDTIIVECNYQAAYVDENAENLAHIFKGHMGLDTCLEFIKANQTDSLRNVILCHMSGINANPDECLEAVERTVGDGVIVYLAERGLEVTI